MSNGFAGVNVCNAHFDELDSDTEKSVSNTNTRECICIGIDDHMLTPPCRSLNSIANFPRDSSEIPTPLARVLALVSSRAPQYLAMSPFHIFEALSSLAYSGCSHLRAKVGPWSMLMINWHDKFGLAEVPNWGSEPSDADPITNGQEIKWITETNSVV